MAFWVDYIWQSTFCLLFFYGMYFILLRKEKVFTFNRWYLLISPILSLVFPLIHIPVSFYKPDISLEQTEFFRAFSANGAPENPLTTYGLPEVLIQSTKLPTIWSIQDYLFLTYLIIVFALIFRFFWNFITLRLIKERGWFQAYYNLKNDYFLIPTFGMAPVFSFFNNLFWDDSLEISVEEKQQIIQHELAHIKKKHSFDILYYQILSILFWFNPGIHLMRNELVDIHEYQADESVLQSSQQNKHNYSQLIVKIAFKGINLSLGNYFIRSTTLKRILMMKNSKKINWGKLMMIMPLSLMLMALISMKTETGQNLQNSELTNWKPAKENDENIAMVRQIFIPFTGSKNQGTAKEIINDTIPPQKEPTKTNEGELIYDVVEYAPEFKGGMEAWNRYVKKNMKYPEAAKLNQVEGVVYIKFFIDKNGKTGKPEILRGIGYGADEEAIRMISESPAWVPGMHMGEAVNVNMRLPIRFKLDEKKNSAILSNATVVDSGPTPSEDFNVHLRRNIKYPTKARLAETSGTVVTALKLDKNGIVKGFDVVESPSEELKEEVIRVLKNNDNSWTVSGDKEEYLVTLPITFIIHKVEPSSNIYQGMKHEVVVTGYNAREKKTPFTVKMVPESDKQPLFILDGEVISNGEYLSGLDPNQIQHIEVLKGEKALEKTLKYDVTKHTGIVVITTKK